MLEAPSSLLSRRATLPALKSALGSVGLSHPPTAAAALSALEEWHTDSTCGQLDKQHEQQHRLHSSGGVMKESSRHGDEVYGVIDDEDALATHLPELLPLLSPFLTFTGGTASSSTDGSTSGGGAARSKVKVARGKRLQQQNSGGEGGEGGLNSSDLAHAEVEALQRRAVAFLGHLGGANRYIHDYLLLSSPRRGRSFFYFCARMCHKTKLCIGLNMCATLHLYYSLFVSLMVVRACTNYQPTIIRLVALPADEALRKALVYDDPPAGTLTVEVDLGAGTAQDYKPSQQQQQHVHSDLEIPALLPRLIELALGAQRQSRVLAAECFHAAVLNLVNIEGMRYDGCSFVFSSMFCRGVVFSVCYLFFVCVLQRNGANIQDAIRIVNLLCIRSGLPPLAPPLASPTTMAVPQLLRYC